MVNVELSELEEGQGEEVRGSGVRSKGHSAENEISR